MLNLEIPLILTKNTKFYNECSFNSLEFVRFSSMYCSYSKSILLKSFTVVKLFLVKFNPMKHHGNRFF